jgi:hypothetical protein
LEILNRTLLVASPSHKYLTNLWCRFLRKKALRYTINFDSKLTTLAGTENFLFCFEFPLTTTQRYARVADRLREQEMNKWYKMAKKEFSPENLHEIICPGCENTVLRFEKKIYPLKGLE